MERGQADPAWRLFIRWLAMKSYQIIMIIFSIAAILLSCTAIHKTKLPRENSTINTYQVVTATETKKYYDIPLSHDLQDFVFEQCEQYGISEKLVLAIICVESECIPDKVNGGRYIGLMQIDSKNYNGDLMNPKTNIWTGIQILSYLYTECNGSTDRVILAFNNGISGAKGMKTSSYLKKVMNKMNSLEAV